MHPERYATPQTSLRRELNRPRPTAKIAGSRKGFGFVTVRSRTPHRGAGQKAGGGALFDEGADGLLAAIAVPEGPAVDVHADKLVGDFGFHIASELHGVVQGFFAVLEAVFDAIFNGFSDLQTEGRPQGTADGISTQGKRETRLLIPPDAEVNDAVHTKLREEKLAFVDKEPGFDDFVLDGVEDLVEGHDDWLKVWLKEFQSEVGGGFLPGTPIRLPR